MTTTVAQELTHFPRVELLERIRLTARASRRDWLDLLGLQFSEYQKFKSGRLQLSDRILENVSTGFSIPIEMLKSGDIDFSGLSIRLENPDALLPEKYRQAAYSRKRTLLSAFDFLEKNYGWRLRLDIQQKFCIPERELCSVFEPISIRFITDVCSYLKRRSFSSGDFAAMGAHDFETNCNSIIAKIFGEQRSLVDMFELLFGDALKLYEQNCTYKIVNLDGCRAVVEMKSNPDVAAETGVRYLGNEQTCHLKGGVIASSPKYLGLAAAQVVHTSCVHRGDSRCLYEISYAETLKRNLN